MWTRQEHSHAWRRAMQPAHTMGGFAELERGSMTIIMCGMLF